MRKEEEENKKQQRELQRQQAEAEKQQQQQKVQQQKADAAKKKEQKVAETARQKQLNPAAPAFNPAAPASSRQTPANPAATNSSSTNNQEATTARPPAALPAQKKVPATAASSAAAPTSATNSKKTAANNSTANSAPTVVPSLTAKKAVNKPAAKPSAKPATARVASAPATPAASSTNTRMAAHEHTDFFGADSAVDPHTESKLRAGLLKNVDIKEQREDQIKAMHGLTRATRLRHIGALRKWKSTTQTRGWEHLSLADGFVKYITELAKERGWKATTKLREAANLLGAFSQLPYYTASKLSLYPAREKIVEMAMKQWSTDAKQAQPIDQPQAVASDVKMAVEQEKDTTVRALLMLQWCFAGRQGDIIKAKRDRLSYDEEKGVVKLLFTEGKIVAMGGGPYTLSSTVPEPWRAELARFLRSRPTGEQARLFDESEKLLGAKATAALRAVNSSLNARSIRRGALQAMAAAGVDLDMIQRFAGHSRQLTTLRYLGWASKWTQGQKDMANATHQALGFSLANEQTSEGSQSPTTSMEREDVVNLGAGNI